MKIKGKYPKLSAYHTGKRSVYSVNEFHSHKINSRIM